MRRVPFLFVLAFSCPYSAGAQTAEASQPRPSANEAAWAHFAAASHRTLTTLQAGVADLGPLPDGVVELGFRELFGPIGDRGLEFSPKLRALAGRRVRLIGYMVREPQRPGATFLLAPYPVTVEQGFVCTQIEVPATAVHVHTPGAKRPQAFRPGRFAVVGRLELGSQPEADGRNSCVRLVLDPVAVSPTPASAEIAASGAP